MSIHSECSLTRRRTDFYRSLSIDRLRNSIVPMLDIVLLFFTCRGCDGFDALWKECLEKGILWHVLDEVLCRCTGPARTRRKSTVKRRRRMPTYPGIQYRAIAKSIQTFMDGCPECATSLSFIRNASIDPGMFTCILPRTFQNISAQDREYDPWVVSFLRWRPRGTNRPVPKVPLDVPQINTGSNIGTGIPWRSALLGFVSMSVHTRSFFTRGDCEKKQRNIDALRFLLSERVPDVLLLRSGYSKEIVLQRGRVGSIPTYVIVDYKSKDVQLTRRDLAASVALALNATKGKAYTTVHSLSSGECFRSPSGKVRDMLHDHGSIHIVRDRWVLSDPRSSVVSIARVDLGKNKKISENHIRIGRRVLHSQKCDVVFLVVPNIKCYLDFASWVGWLPSICPVDRLIRGNAGRDPVVNAKSMMLSRMFASSHFICTHVQNRTLSHISKPVSLWTEAVIERDVLMNDSLGDNAKSESTAQSSKSITLLGCIHESRRCQTPIEEFLRVSSTSNPLGIVEFVRGMTAEASKNVENDVLGKPQAHMIKEWMRPPQSLVEKHIW